MLQITKSYLKSFIKNRCLLTKTNIIVKNRENYINSFEYIMTFYESESQMNVKDTSNVYRLFRHSVERKGKEVH